MGSSLNIMPKNTLTKLNAKRTLMKTSSMVVKAFDKSKRMVIGEVDLPMVVGPHMFITTFQVMDINPRYIYLLGRPLIQVVVVVTSTLHQKLKFVVGDKLVITEGEEEMLISHLASLRYIETVEEILETLF